MKAISIWQPHASLIVMGLKPFETRSWTAWKSLIGKRIWIHAGKALDDLLDLNEYLEDRNAGHHDQDYDAYVEALRACGFKYLRDMPRGCLIGTAVLEASLPTENLTNPGPFGNFGPGRFAWQMTDPIPLATPIPFAGKQGFFEVQDYVFSSADFALSTAAVLKGKSRNRAE